MSNTTKIMIDDGTKAYDLVNNYGKKICTVYFRPSDLSIIDRYHKVQDTLPEITEPLQNLNINADGTAAFETGWDALKQAEEKLIAKLDWLFDMSDAASIFATRNPFSRVGGRFFCAVVLDALGELIEQEVTKEVKASQERMAEYLPKIEVTADAGAAPEND